jgi:hypothetical protein
VDYSVAAEVLVDGSYHGFTDLVPYGVLGEGEVFLHGGPVGVGPDLAPFDLEGEGIGPGGVFFELTGMSGTGIHHFFLPELLAFIGLGTYGYFAGAHVEFCINTHPGTSTVGTCMIAPLLPVGSYKVTYEYTVSAVPVPAAVWLFGTALLGLVGFSKRRKTV